MIKLHTAGEEHAKRLVEHGKVSDKPFTFDKADADSLLGPKGSHIEEFARHHLGEDDSKEETDPKRYRYPFAKEGQVHARALRSIMERAGDNGHDEVRTSAEGLIRLIEDGGGDTDHQAGTGEQGEKQRFVNRRSEARKVVEEDGKWYIKSEDGEKKLGGPYDTEEEAKKRLMQVETFKHEAKSATRPQAEQRCLIRGVELRSAPNGQGPGTLVGYAAVYDRWSEGMPFRERILPGAFDAVMGQDVRAVANHDPRQLLGRRSAGTLRMQSDSIGLRVEIDLPDTQAGRDTAVSCRRGDMDGMSFEFDVEPGPEGASWDFNATPPTRTIRRFANLYDVGPVTYPAYPDTSAAMRSLDRARAATDDDRRSLSLAKARQRLAEALQP